MSGYNGKRRINGSYGFAELDGDVVFEIQAVDTNIEISREDVMMSGTNQIATKIVSTKGEGSFTVNKVWSRFKGSYLNELSTEGDPEFTLRLWIKDPDNGGREEVLLTNCKFDGTFNVLSYTLGEMMEQEFNFVYMPKDLVTQSTISRRT